MDIKQPGLLLKGNSLPGLNGIEIDFRTEDNKGRMLLFCFFDMNQRPSRRCLSEIAKQAEQLKDNGVSIVAIQATKIHRDRLNEWIKENGIPFPVGIIDKDVENTRFAWGVRSLPWLILTDSRHIVVDSGFSLNEIDDKIMVEK